jgi:hypothetical protein
MTLPLSSVSIVSPWSFVVAITPGGSVVSVGWAGSAGGSFCDAAEPLPGGAGEEALQARATAAASDGARRDARNAMREPKERRIMVVNYMKGQRKRQDGAGFVAVAASA